MWIGRATIEQNKTFSEWRKFERLEEQTCRPVIDGQRISRSDEFITLAFLIDGSSIEEYKPKNESYYVR